MDKFDIQNCIPLQQFEGLIKNDMIPYPAVCECQDQLECEHV